MPASTKIKILKDDYAVDTAVIKKRIDVLREGNIDDKSQVNAQIEVAEANILKAQNNIDDLIIDREPLEAKMIKLEAEVGPVKYIASLVVDWGITTEVNTSEAVRWVILIIIFVFDPLAVLLLVAANQSLIRRFPVEPIKPQEIVDLEKPDEEDVTLKWNEMFNKEDQAARMEQATAQLKEWKDKLDEFNKKVPKPEDKPVEIVQEDPQKKTEEKEIVADNMKDGFDPSEVEGYDEFNKKYEQDKKAKDEQLERFKKREQEEIKALEEYSRKARDDETEKLYEQSIAEQIEEVMESERLKPDFTEVIEPEVSVKPKNELRGTLGTVLVKNKKVVKPAQTKLTNWQRAELLDKFHNEHGNFQDADEYVQNEEQSEKTLWQKSKKATSENDYHTRVEQRINDLMAKIENKEIKLSDLPEEDQRVINEINQQKKDG